MQLVQAILAIFVQAEKSRQWDDCSQSISVAILANIEHMA